MKVKHLGLVFSVFILSCGGMRGLYDGERSDMLQQSLQGEQILRDSIMTHLPQAIQKYLRVSGHVGKPIPYNCEIHWKESFIKLKRDAEWGELNIEQFNSVQPIGRISFMEFDSMPVKGRDIYIGGYGEMKGKLFNLLTVVEGSGPEISQSAMIVAFAEFPIIPGYVFSKNVVWDTIDSVTVRATLQESGFSVTGLFHFDEEGLYKRFETNDRFFHNEDGVNENFPYTTVIHSYQEQGDLLIPHEMSAVWNLPNEDFEYFKGSLDRLEFNVNE